MVWIRMWRPELSCLLIAAATGCAAVVIEEGTSQNYWSGDDASLTCTGRGPLRWELPAYILHNIKNISKEKSILDLKNLTKYNAGFYYCSDIGYRNKYATIKVNVKSSFIDFIIDKKFTTIEANDTTKSVHFQVKFNASQNVKFSWTGPNGINGSGNPINKYHIERKFSELVFTINNLNPNDEGVYVILGEAGDQKARTNLTLIIGAAPKVTLKESYGFYIYNKTYDLKCNIEAYPMAKIKWLFMNCTDYNNCGKDGKTTLKEEDMYENKFTSNISLEAQTSGYLECQACSKKRCNSESMPFFISDSAKGISLTGPSDSIEGEDVVLTCSVSIYNFTNINWLWKLSKESSFNQIGNKKGYEHYKSSFGLYSQLTIANITKKDIGYYMCRADNLLNKGPRVFSDVIHLSIASYNESFIEFDLDEESISTEVYVTNKSVTFELIYNATKNAVFSLFGPNGIIRSGHPTNKYNIHKSFPKLVFTINNLSTSDEGVYGILGKAGYKEAWRNVTLIITGPPKVTLTKIYGFFIYNQTYDLICNIEAYPLAKITWLFMNCTDYLKCDKNGKITMKQENMYEKNFTSHISLKAQTSGNLVCQACNENGCNSESMAYFISDSAAGIKLTGPSDAIEGEDAVLQCLVSIYNFTGITWLWRPHSNSSFKQLGNKKEFHKNEGSSSHSVYSQLTIENLTLKNHNEEYRCSAKGLTDNLLLVNSNTLRLSIKERTHPIFKNKQNDSHTIYTGIKKELDCSFEGLPRPEIHWFKNGKRFESNDADSRIIFSPGNQVLTITNTLTEDAGSYECFVNNSVGSKRSFNLKVIKSETPSKSNTQNIVVAVMIVFVILLSAVAYLIWRNRKANKSEKLLTGDVTAFYEGVLLTIDPDLSIDEQAELLPYIDDFEFPKERLKFGKQIGSGPFRKVMKAEADGLEGEEKITTVAVKMVKPNLDITHLKALMTELKILTYVGHHLNVLNLLGACTTNLIRRELFLIFEYCRYGNLCSYLREHRGTYVNQVDPITDEIDFSIVNEACVKANDAKASQRLHRSSKNELQAAFDNYSSQLEILETTGESSISITADKHKEVGPLNQRWSVDYKGDFKRKHATHLCTKDLICWSYQVAMGMEYLSDLEIVHGDLAARNILLADNNVVKICDFSLACHLNKTDDHKNKGQVQDILDSLLIKWIAMESIEERIFSTKSDVWSFGIVLWEFFTLGKIPYPGMDMKEELFKQLNKGYRMSKPEYSTHEMYRVMQGCWKATPTARPSFTDLVHRIGETLDDELKMQYTELNIPHLDHNTKIKNILDNYLTVTTDGNDSEEHHYVNLE